jgi:succinate dehydrogenase / fumarate reductase, cytochrome b subunit
MPPLLHESHAMTAASKRPEFRNISAFSDLPTYRLPAAGLVSILHRISGVLLFVLLPFIMWMFDKSLS